MYRILSLDGGGIRGAYTASVLATLEEATERKIVDHFDLIAGTSTGGIIAIGLALGFSAREICEFYRTQGSNIFPATGLRGRIRQLFQPKFRQAGLRSALSSILGDRRFGDARTRLVIPCYDATRGRLYLMKTAHHPRFQFDHRALAVDVALATSAAPTYFEAANFSLHSDASYVDGGVWANCPALPALLEAIMFLGQAPEQIEMLSIGTTGAPFSIARNNRAGALKWNIGLIDLIMQAQAEASLKQADLMLGGRIHRIDYLTEKDRFTLDKADPGTIEQLIALGNSDGRARINLEAVSRQFLNGRPVAPFIPLHQS